VLAEILAGLELSFSELCRTRRLHPATPTRWRRKGVLAASGGPVRLEAVRIGRRWITSVPAFERFITATSEPDAVPATEQPRPPAARRKASNQASDLLAGEGW
jgi:hypothetical protein